MGDVDVQVLIRDSRNDCQWRAGLMQLPGQKPPQKPPGFRLRSAVWKFDELICVSHIVPLISVTRIVPVRTSCSFCMCSDILRCLLCCRDVRTFRSPVRIQLESLTPYSFRNQPPELKHAHMRSSTSKICRCLRLTKKGK